MFFNAIFSRVLSTISEAESEAFSLRCERVGDYEDGYGCASFPVRLTASQAHRLADALDEQGIPFCYEGYPRVNPKAVYSLWVEYRAPVFGDCCTPAVWGLSRLTD